MVHYVTSVGGMTCPRVLDEFPYANVIVMVIMFIPFYCCYSVIMDYFGLHNLDLQCPTERLQFSVSASNSNSKFSPLPQWIFTNVGQ